jgi:hypothetical protein
MELALSFTARPGLWIGTGLGLFATAPIGSPDGAWVRFSQVGLSAQA